jgi:hypothetical protein
LLTDNSENFLHHPSPDVLKIFLITASQLPTDRTTSFFLVFITSGALYSWRPSIFSLRSLTSTLPHHLLATFFVFFSVFVAAFISYRVPPEGVDSRTAAQIAILGVWVLSFVLHIASTAGMECYGHLHGCQAGNGKEARWHILTFVKDTIFELATTSSILVTQLGIFNRRDCFTLWGRVPVMLPEIDEVKEVFMRRIAGEWLGVTSAWVVLEIVVWGMVWWWYQEAVKV